MTTPTHGTASPAANGRAAGCTLEQLAATATLGTGHRPATLDRLPLISHPTRPVDPDPAAALLDAAALLVGAQSAGYRPARTTERPDVCPPDTAAELPARAGDLLAHAVTATGAAGELDLVSWLLTAAAAAGYRAPAPLLPVLFTAAARSRNLRGPLTACLGARGRWLAAHHPDWARLVDRRQPHTSDTPTPTTTSAMGDSVEDVWNTGTLDQRHTLLTELRRTDPAAARGLLTATWKSETGEDREQLLPVLADQLTGDDEPLLETALEDRRSAVARTARDLLTTLTDSAYARRVTARALPLLRIERRGLRRRLLVTLPEQPDPAATRDGIVTKTPDPSVGPSAWWLVQQLAAVPLDAWTAHLDRDPHELAAMAGDTEFANELRAAWRSAAVRQHDVRWAHALLRDKHELTHATLPATSDGDLLAVLPADLAAAYAAREVKGVGIHTLDVMLAAVPGPWPDALAVAVLSRVSSEIRTSLVMPFSATLTRAGICLPLAGRTDYAAQLRHVAESLDTTGPRPALAAALRSAAGTVELRRLFTQELHP